MNHQQQNPSADSIAELNFETAFSRLEAILELLNSGSITLDASLRLYEEADTLITLCSKRLNDAEHKIEILIKNRNGEIALSNDQRPITQDFQIPSQSPLRQNKP